MPFRLFVKDARACTLGLVGLMLLFAATTSAQPLSGDSIVYNQYDFTTGQAVAQLSVINSDGTGDRRLLLNLPEPGYPVWAKDGTLLALTSPDPARPFKISRDVFTYDLANGQTTKVAGYDDAAGPQDGVFFMPLFKAFSPDSRQLAVSALRFSYSSITVTFTNAMFTNGIPGQPTQEQSAVTLSPVLSIFTPGEPVSTLVMLGDVNEGLYHGGDGLDWSAAQNKLVYPVKVAAPFENSSLDSYVTALYVLDPVSNAFVTGHARQLTFPRGRVSNSLFDPVLVAWEQDIQPAVSADGQRVAYVRLSSALTAPFGQRIFDTASLRIVNFDGSNDHEVIAFRQGSYVSHVTWSSDGHQLVFDGGQQAASEGAALPMVLAGTVELYTIRTDGADFRKLRSAAATWPAWRPATTEPAPGRTDTPLRVRSVMANGARQVIVSWPAPATNVLLNLETSNALGPEANWLSLPAIREIVDGEQRIAFPASARTGFYRLRVR